MSDKVHIFLISKMNQLVKKEIISSYKYFSFKCIWGDGFVLVIYLNLSDSGILKNEVNSPKITTFFFFLNKDLILVIEAWIRRM